MLENNKYLTQYGEPECTFWDGLNIPSHEYCLVIPAYQECYENLAQVWKDISADVLIIVIANAPAPDIVTSELIKTLKSKALESKVLEKNFGTLTTVKNLSYLPFSDQPNILLIERCPIPIKQGVGLARKIGADVALSMIEHGAIKTPWIFCTDADVVLPKDYFKHSADIKKNSSAIIYPFHHHAPKSYQVACSLYEATLYYYVLGLKFAHSSYAYPTIGSTIAIDAQSYAAVRGFPTRSAGEDFYLLNKLAKVGEIQSLTHPEISIEGRLSERVPFGTGIGIKRIQNLADQNLSLLFYHPQTFFLLKQLLEKLNNCYQINDLESFFESEVNSESIVLEWCLSQKLFKIIQSKQSQKKSVFYKFIHDWMDGFRTLKFIHFVRDHYFPSQPWQTLFEGLLLDGLLLEEFLLDGSLPDKTDLASNKPTNGEEFRQFLKDRLIDSIR